MVDRLLERVGPERLGEWCARLTRPTGPPPRPTRRGLAFDAALASSLGVAAVLYVLDNMTGILDRGDRPAPVPGAWIGPVIVALLASAPLTLRRRYPLAVLWIVLAAVLVTPHEAPRLTFYACVVAAYGAAAYSPYRLPTLVSLGVAVLLVGTDAALPTVPDRYAPYLIMVPIVVAADGLRTWKLRTAEGRRRLSALEREQDEALRRAVADERARIARELHDVVTHNVSVMVIQAGAARTVMDAHPDRAREALLAVEAGGRAAMTELRHVMGLLTPRTPGDPDGPDPGGTEELAPQPGLGQLEALVARVGRTGTPVGLTVTGHRRPLPSGIELAAYRVVQEALTNTVRHAAGASAAVTVDYAAGRLRVEVTDTGGTPGASRTAGGATGSGRGLIGLRERLAVYGGTLRSGPHGADGYRVTALIPLDAS
ncbi:sensor histidine kinase [Streptomyces sp. LBUM 1478]|uniref:sensor histidine kinase n=1 Tax=Streptomyces scabiei TaxID=1930 RepID=UPI000773AF14|nr:MULTISPECIES: histidine kinase [Streptomyces]MBP5865347.1 sensor histidine kinase [Streptomyces sp. LBUM 1484]MBP5910503.1 sensor histidine kinase [Streptomyces sp. LBUM 1478]MBP5933417.1 sensor histidine kinase [Streptomyces sp. LBUM 1479]MBP5873968.1 sensor histidine kinase [Streptomyces sp. LBUM 1477]MBP5881683.1 sensor histidine kinase [Streptomyces sp. LBUM 1487]